MATLAPVEPHVRTLRPATVGLIGFLTLVDLFAAQAILPALALRYDVGPAEIGLAANASTLGMAVAGLFAGVFGRSIDRRRGIWLSLGLLAMPTLLLSIAPNLTAFALLRIAQGLCMATAFTLTLTYLAERCTVTGAATALAAYVTGGVASNLVGRLIAATVVDYAGTGAGFLLFAALNLFGAALVAGSLSAGAPGPSHERQRPFWAGYADHLRNAQLLLLYGIGFLILFAFIGVFSYVGFVLAAPPFALSMTALGLVFLVFAPSMITTPAAGRIAQRIGPARALSCSLLLALLSLPLLATGSLPAMIAGLTLVGIGTFFAQAIATGSVGRVARQDRAAASGLYLSAYYCGGLAGAAAIGQIFARFGWTAALLGVGTALILAALIATRLRTA
jgi:MFS transporter, YNFM family, putative membrane transport protein